MPDFAVVIKLSDHGVQNPTDEQTRTMYGAGDIVDYRPAPFFWGNQVGPPDFLQITITVASAEDIECLIAPEEPRGERVTVRIPNDEVDAWTPEVSGYDMDDVHSYEILASNRRRTRIRIHLKAPRIKRACAIDASRIPSAARTTGEWSPTENDFMNAVTRKSDGRRGRDMVTRLKEDRRAVGQVTDRRRQRRPR